MFCYPEHIAREMKKLFDALRNDRCLRGLDQAKFVVALAGFLADLNAIHPFRDSNGRTQLAFAALIASQAGHPIDFAKLHPRKFLAAMVDSFRGETEELEAQLSRLTARRPRPALP